MTENAVTSDAVPLVEGMPTKIAFCRSFGIVNGPLMSSNVLSGYS